MDSPVVPEESSPRTRRNLGLVQTSEVDVMTEGLGVIEELLDIIFSLSERSEELRDILEGATSD